MTSSGKKKPHIPTNGDGPQPRGDRLALRLADLALNHPWKVIVVVVLMVAIAATGAANLSFSTNYRVFFGPDNPELLTFEAFQDTYTKNDNIVFVLQPREGTVFTPRLAEATEWLTAEAWKIPYAIRVDSVTNFQHSWANGDELTVEDLVRDGGNLAPTELERRRDIALAEPLLHGNLISPDADTTGINVTLQYPEESIAEVPEAVAFARNLAAQIESKHPDVRVALSGVSMLNNAFAEAGMTDSFTLIPLMFGVLVVFMLVVLRSVWGAAATFAVIALSTATALGIAGHVGLQIDPVSATAPIIILTLAIADSVHILVTLFGLMRDGMDKVDALRESLRINFLPVLITSITTIIGFLTLNFSDAPPFWLLGNITAIGIGAALVLSVTLLPALLRLMPLRAPARKADEAGTSRLAAFSDWVTSNYRSVLTVTGVVALGLALLAPTVDLNDEFIKYFDHRVPFRGDAEFAIDNLNGVYILEFSLEAGEPGGISDPIYLQKLDAFSGWLRSQPEVMHVFTYSDIIKRLNRNMHGDDPAWHRLPDDRELAAQYLLLYELSLPYGLDLNDRINIDKSATRVSASLGDVTTVQTRKLLERTEVWLDGELTADMSAEPTGAQVMFSHISQRNIDSMLRGNAVAVVLIAGIMMLALRSVAMGGLSLLPNALPVLMTFGIWAVLVRQVGMAAATVTATSLGIVVDDTVHFLTKYMRARREKSLDRPDAIRYAFETTGKAIISTTIILAFGFGALALSTFRINSQMGLLTALTIVVALLVDFFLLPSLLMVGHRVRERSTTMNVLSASTRKAAATGLMVVLLLTSLPTAPLASAGTTAIVSAATEELLKSATTPEEKGFALAARSDRTDRGFGDSRVELEMVLRNRAGKETTRTLSLTTLEVPDEDTGDKSLIIFDKPADIDGTALLSHARILDPDDQWLFLPALRRVKRISSVNKSGPFVGSEFAFEDFTALELNKYAYRYLRSEACGDLMCDVIERTPRYEHSGYTRQVTWVDQDVYQARKVEFYDRRGDLLKTLELTDYRVYDQHYWRAQRMAMVNHQTGKSTDLIYSDYTFGVGLGDNDFVKGVLQRVR